jgi:hypothetical protein
MRLTRLPAALVAAVLLAGIASCATTVSGSGTIAADVVTNGPTPTGGSGEPGGSDAAGSDPGSANPGGTGVPTDDPAPTPTVDPVRVRERALCVLERAAITSINISFNKSKQRSQQVQILKQGAATLAAQLSRSGLPSGDAIQRAGKNVQTQLAKLYAAADAGQTPSTSPYNSATQSFQRACNSIP